MVLLLRLLGLRVTAFLLFSALNLGVRAENVSFVVLVPPVEDASGAVPDGYFPLSPALDTIVRLAGHHINEDGSYLDGNVSLSVVHSATASEAAANLCSELVPNVNSTVAVLSTLGTSSASLIGSLSNGYLDLPILTVGASAARAEARDGVNGGYLLSIDPDIFKQMEALVRLILDMKLARDLVDGRSETTEYVRVVHTSDTYGSTAAAAFGRATTQISVDLPLAETDESEEEAEPTVAVVEIVSTTVLPASAEAEFDAELAVIAEEDASIVVLLAEGYDGAIVRAILSQAEQVGLAEGVQWYLPDAAAFDHIFDHNSSYRNAELAYELRGTLGLRVCPPLTGPGADLADALTQEWKLLDPTEYPGAGPESLNADNRIDPMLAFVHDAVYLAAAAAGVAQQVVNLTGIPLDRCPFPVNGSWEDGPLLLESIYNASYDLTQTTGLMDMADLGIASDARDAETVTYCAVNLRPHGTMGARFETIQTLDGAGLANGEGFQVVSQFQEEQTFPAGASTYPFDRPILRGRHLDIVTKRSAAPFVFVEGSGDSLEDYTGITPLLLKSLSELLGFTYTLRAPPEGTPTTTTIEMVRNGSADMTASWVTITAERSEYISFTYPYYDLGISFVYKGSTDEGVDLWKAFAPFEPELWLALLVALVVTVFMLWVFEGAKNDQFSHGNWGKRRRTVSRGLSRSVYVTASLMMAQLTHKPETLEGYLLTLGWLFTSFVLAASYTAELASFLTATKLASTGVSINGLMSGEVSHSSVALLQGGNTQFLYERDFMKCTGDACSIGVQPLPCFSTNECFEMVKNGTALTTPADSPTAQYELQNDFCGLSILPELLYPQHYGLVLPFGSPLVEEFQQATLTLREDGTLAAHEALFLDESSPCVATEEDEGDTSNMTVGDVSGVFVVLGIFVALSLVSWCMRRSPMAKSVKARRRRARGLEPGSMENIADSFAKMTRRQQKSFALEATVRLLQDSKVTHNSSLGVFTGSPGEDPEEARRRAHRSKQKDEIAEGRPVVSLGGSGSSRNLKKPWRTSGTRLLWRSKSSSKVGGSESAASTSASVSGSAFPATTATATAVNSRRTSTTSRDGFDRNVAGNGGGDTDEWASHKTDGDWTPPQSPGHGGGDGGGSRGGGASVKIFGRAGAGAPPPADAEAVMDTEAPVGTAASKWLSKRSSPAGSSGVGGTTGSGVVVASSAAVEEGAATTTVLGEESGGKIVNDASVSFAPTAVV